MKRGSTGSPQTTLIPTPPFQGRVSKTGITANRLDAGRGLMAPARLCLATTPTPPLKRRGLHQPPIVRWRSNREGSQQLGVAHILNSSSSLAKASLAVVLLVRCLHQSGQREPRHWDVPRYQFHYHWTGPRESRALRAGMPLPD